MKLKKAIAMIAAVAVFAGSALSVSAAEKLSSDEINALKESGKVELILDVEAYKAAYSDLEKAFGDNVDAYIEHYLTIGVYEGRNKGVLFDPLVYVESYGDVMNAFGTDISAIVNHYVTFGAAEKRVAGTANGYADLATAEKNGVTVSRSNAANNYANNVANYIANSGAGNGNVSEAYAYNAMDIAIESNYSGAPVGGGNTDVNSNAATNSNAAINSNNAGSAAVSAPAGSNAAGSSAATPPSYHHTTSHYADDEKTLIRVEYYDENNKLLQYSEVTDFDSDTNSYKETIYNASDMGLDRTDTYKDGSLSSSEKSE